MMESWVQKWYSDYLARWGYAPSYDEYVKAGGKASLQEYYSAQLSEIKYVATPAKPVGVTLASTSSNLEASQPQEKVNVPTAVPTAPSVKAAVAPSPSKRQEDFIGLFAKTIDEAIADFRKLVKNMTGIEI